MKEKVSALEAHVSGLLGHARPQTLEEMKNSIAKDELERVGAVMHGHFRMRENQHSRIYIKLPEDFFSSSEGRNILRLFKHRLEATVEFALSLVQVIIGVERGGVPFAEAFANLLNLSRKEEDFVKVVKVTKNPGSDVGYQLAPEAAKELRDKMVLVADDVFNTGITLGGIVLPMLRQTRARISGALVIANRGNASLPLFCPFSEYWKIPDDECFPAAACPMCEAGEPMTQF